MSELKIEQETGSEWCEHQEGILVTSAYFNLYAVYFIKHTRKHVFEIKIAYM